MLKLRKILLCDNIYRVTALIVLIISLAVTLLPNYKSKYKGNENEFTCLVKEYKMFARKKDRIIETIMPSCKKHGTFKAIDELNLTIKKGESLGILGKNGAGKSTIFRMILNILEPDEGEVLYNGQKIDHSISDRIGYLPEVGSLIDSYTVYEQCIYYGKMKSMKSEDIKNNMFGISNGNRYHTSFDGTP